MKFKNFTLAQLFVVVCTFGVVVFLFYAIVEEIERKSLFIRSLRSVQSGQNIFWCNGFKDRDRDAVGEAGYFTELSGTLPIPPGSLNSLPAHHSFINSRFGETSLRQKGLAQRYGYYFRMYLPSGKKTPLSETGKTVSTCFPPSPSQQKEIDAQERHWAFYAWPVKANRYNYRCFFANETGELYFTSNQLKKNSGYVFSGKREPHPDEIFDLSTGVDLSGKLILGKPTPISGLVWRPYNGNENEFDKTIEEWFFFLFLKLLPLFFIGILFFFVRFFRPQKVL